jgi:hypothetical protein
MCRMRVFVVVSPCMWRLLLRFLLLQQDLSLAALVTVWCGAPLQHVCICMGGPMGT